MNIQPIDMSVIYTSFINACMELGDAIKIVLDLQCPFVFDCTIGDVVMSTFIFSAIMEMWTLIMNRSNIDI